MAEETTEIVPRRHINLTKGERKDLVEQKRLEHIVSLFLDLERDRNWSEIATEVGMSLAGLKRLTKTSEFQELYDSTLATLGHHPRLVAMQSNLPDLLPSSFRAMRELLNQGRGMARLGAVKLLWETLSVGDTPDMEDPNVISNFMKNKGLLVEGDVNINVNLPIPAEYQKAFSRLMGGDIIDATILTSETAAE
jgi:hypothetical protein